MKLSQLAAKPQLVKIVIDDEVIQERYGEALEFYVYDRQNMETFIKLAAVNDQDFGAVTAAVKDLILDEDGRPIITDGQVLPSDVLMRAITQVVETLGKQLASPTAKPKD